MMIVYMSGCRAMGVMMAKSLTLTFYQRLLRPIFQTYEIVPNKKYERAIFTVES